MIRKRNLPLKNIVILYAMQEISQLTAFGKVFLFLLIGLLLVLLTLFCQKFYLPKSQIQKS